jgi:hypothetical protein
MFTSEHHLLNYRPIIKLTRLDHYFPLATLERNIMLRQSGKNGTIPLIWYEAIAFMPQCEAI